MRTVNSTFIVALQARSRAGTNVRFLLGSLQLQVEAETPVDLMPASLEAI
jgi:hypothetical protein